MQLGLASLTRRLVSAGDVTAIRVLDKNYFMLAFESTPSSQVSMEIDYAAMPFLQQAIQAGETVSFAQDDLLVVVAPVTDLEEQPLGAVMVYLSMDYVQATLNRQVRLTVVVAGVALGWDCWLPWCWPAG